MAIKDFDIEEEVKKRCQMFEKELMEMYSLSLNHNPAQTTLRPSSATEVRMRGILDIITTGGS